MDDILCSFVIDQIGSHPKHRHCQHSASQQESDQNSIKVGPFLFSKSVLSDSHSELKDATECDWVIIDEIGPLEMRRKQGYEPAVSQILNARKSEQFRNTKFVIVVRPSLKDQIASTYQLDRSEIGDFKDVFSWRNMSVPTQYGTPLVAATLCAMAMFIVIRHQSDRNRH